jgi:ABC-type Mn2+/Zn2+ transport system permease subunit
MHTLIEPWTHGFMQQAALELVLLGVVGGVLGCWIVLYELSYSAESLAHALFPGLVGAALLGVPLLFGAAAGALVAAVGIAIVGRRPELGRDTAVAVVITSLFGLGVVLALSPSAPPGVSDLLFGDLLGVTRSDLLAAAVLGSLVLLALGALHRRLLAVGFDRGSAAAMGGRPVFVDVALLGLLATTIVIGVQSLGNLLVLAVIVAPAGTARFLTRRMLPMMLTAVAVAVACGIGGLYLSYYANTAGGASVAAVMVGVYLVARATRPGRARAGASPGRRRRASAPRPPRASARSRA